MNIMVLAGEKSILFTFEAEDRLPAENFKGSIEFSTGNNFADLDSGYPDNHDIFIVDTKNIHCHKRATISSSLI